MPVDTLKNESSDTDLPTDAEASAIDADSDELVHQDLLLREQKVSLRSKKLKK